MKPAFDLKFDHNYMRVPDHQAFANLANRGFTLSPRTVEHPGGSVCRFLQFNRRRDEEGFRPYQYLEFVAIKSLEEYKAHADAVASERGLPPSSAEYYLQPGFSLGVRGADGCFSRLKTEMAEHLPFFEHRNYKWQEEVARGPGWNFITFGKPIVPFALVWITEYEENPDWPKVLEPIVHENSCTSIVGAVWDAPKNDLQSLVRLCGSSSTENSFQVSGDFTLWHGGHEVADLKTFKKESPFKAMVVQCRSLKKFCAVASPDAEISWAGRPAAILDPCNSGWMILVIEE